MELLLTNYPKWELFPLCHSISHVCFIIAKKKKTLFITPPRPSLANCLKRGLVSKRQLARDNPYSQLPSVDACFKHERVFDEHAFHVLKVDGGLSHLKKQSEPMEIYVDVEAKLSLHGLVQHYIKLTELEKNLKLNDLLNALDFNQDVIFVKSVSRATELNKLLVYCNFPSICIHSGMSQEERLARYKAFKDGTQRILVATDLVGRGIDIEQVNIVINYDMPDSADTYLHQVGRDGRFDITFVSSSSDSTVLNQVQERFEVDIKELPEQIDSST